MRKHKIIRINTSDIAIDPVAQSEVVTKACARSPGWFATGLCQVGDSVLVSLEAASDSGAEEYLFAPFDSENIDEILTVIGVRYSSGFSLVGGFEVRAAHWALFRSLPPNRE